MGKTKKERKNEKRIKLRNKKLFKQYPWLAPYENKGHHGIHGVVRTDWKYDYLFMEPEMDGWMKAFFYDLQEGILTEIKSMNRNPRELRIQEYKEKYGSMRLYLNDGNIESGIVENYSQLSENVCFLCGRPDVPMIESSWYLPLCKKCYETTRHSKPYEEVAGKDARMPDEYSYTRYSKEDGEQIITVSVKEEANRIRKRWNKKHPDDLVQISE